MRRLKKLARIDLSCFRQRIIRQTGPWVLSVMTPVNADEGLTSWPSGILK